MELVDILKFIVFFGLAFLVPGLAIVLRSSLKKFPLIIFLSASLGIVIFTLTSLMGGMVGFRYLQLITIPLFLLSLIFVKNRWPLISFKESPKNRSFFLLIIIIFLGTFFQNLISFKSGRNYDFGIGYWGPLAHDGVWHETLSNELVEHFPPNNPTLSGTRLTNYHYFYDLMIADTNRFTGIPTKDLIYRFYPLLFSLLLGIGSYLLSTRFFKNKAAAIISVMFVYFGSSLGWIVEWFRQRTLGGESTFWANQPVSMNLNPPFAISLVLLISAVYLFFLLEKKDKFLYLAFVIISGSLIGFKVYAGVILLSGISLVAITQIITKSNFQFAKLLVPIVIVSGLIFFGQTSKSEGLVEFKPLWLVDSMIDFADRVGWMKLSSARSTYFSSGNWVKYVAAEVVSLAIFIVGNLGTRVVGLVSIFYVLKTKILKANEFVFIFGINLAAIATTLLFVQKGNPWNTIQFFYYFMFFAALLAGFAVYRMAKKLLALPVLILGIIFLVITSLSSFSTFESGFLGAPARITPNEIVALKFLKSKTDGIVLTPPFDINLRKDFTNPFPISVYETTAYVSANTNKPVFIEDEFQQEIFQNDYKNRLVESRKFFSGKEINWSKEFLSKNNIRYIYLEKVYPYKLDEKGLNINKIYENDKVVIYSV